MSYSWSAAITTEPCFNSHTNCVFFNGVNGFENILHYIAIARRTKRFTLFYARFDFIDTLPFHLSLVIMIYSFASLKTNMNKEIYIVWFCSHNKN